MFPLSLWRGGADDSQVKMVKLKGMSLEGLEATSREVQRQQPAASDGAPAASASASSTGEMPHHGISTSMLLVLALARSDPGPQ